jgi:hypothetical protein
LNARIDRATRSSSRDAGRELERVEHEQLTAGNDVERGADLVEVGTEERPNHERSVPQPMGCRSHRGPSGFVEPSLPQIVD